MSLLRYTVLPLLCLSLIVLAIGWQSNPSAPNESKVTELAPGVFFRKAQTEPTFTGCNQGWVIFEDFVLVIDANFPNQADKVMELIRKQTDKPIRYVFDTHHHGDHADGNVRYTDKGATAVASERTKAMFLTNGMKGFEQSKKTKPDEYGKLKYKMPSVYFPHRMVIEDDTQRVELLHFGHAHTMGDAVAWLPKHGILFTGDAAVNGPFNYTGDSNTESWITVLNAMDELPVKVVAPGHGELGGEEIIHKQRQYFSEMRSKIKRFIDDDKTLDEIKKEIKLPFYKKWTGVDVQERVENIEHIYGELSGN